MCEQYTLAPDPGSLAEQDVGKLLRLSELKTIYTVMTRYRDDGMRYMAPGEKRLCRELIQLEWTMTRGGAVD